MPFFSSVVLRTIFLVVPLLLADEPLPLLDDDELCADSDVDDGDFGRIGSGMR